MNLKRTAFLFAFLSISLWALSQPNCPVITYTYDAAGNRVQRKLVVQPCTPLKLRDTSMDKVQTKDSTKTTDMKVKVFPNPALEFVNVELGQLENVKESSVYLYDLQGRLVYSQTTGSDRLQIDVSALGAGEYYLNIVRADKRIAYSILKN